jgi:hypothetical protein
MHRYLRGALCEHGLEILRNLTRTADALLCIRSRLRERCEIHLGMEVESRRHCDGRTCRSIGVPQVLDRAQIVESGLWCHQAHQKWGVTSTAAGILRPAVKIICQSSITILISAVIVPATEQALHGTGHHPNRENSTVNGILILYGKTQK